MLNKYRTNNVATLPTGFHKTVIRTLSKYKLETWWNNCPQIPANEIKNHLRRRYGRNIGTKMSELLLPMIAFSHPSY